MYGKNEKTSLRNFWFDKALETVKQLTILIVSYVCDKRFDGYNDLIYGHTIAKEYGTKLHVTLHESNQKVKEGLL